MSGQDKTSQGMARPGAAPPPVAGSDASVAAQGTASAGGLLPRRLSTRIVVLFLGLLLAVQAASFLVIRASIDRNARAAVADELAVGERVFLRLLAQNAQRLTDSATVLAADFGFRAAVASNDRETIASALANHGDRIGASVTVLLDTAFEPRGAGHAGGEQLLPAVRRILSRAGGNPAAASEIVQIDARPYQVVMVPIRAPLLIGWVVMGFSIDQRLIDDMRELSGLQVSLLARPQARQAWQVEVSSQTPAQATQLAAQLPSDVGQAEHALLVDDDHLSVRLVPLPGGDAQTAVAVLARSIDEAVAPYRELQLLLLVLTLLGVAVFAAGSVLTARRVTTPIRALAAAAERVGRGDYDTPVRAQANDEIGELAGTFDRMRESISSQKREILHLAYWDRLTGLPNRTQFRAEVQRAIDGSLNRPEAAPDEPDEEDLDPGELERRRVARRGRSVSVIMLDLDRFKHVNDVLGYPFGDQLLTAVGERLMAQMVRDGDLVARLGGDEFAVLLPGADAGRAMAVAQRIAAGFDRPLQLGEQPVDLGAGIGIATCPEDGREADVLISRAEVAMYAAKQRTQGPVAYDAALEVAGTQTLSLLSELRHAVDQGELRLYLQPKVSLDGARVLGAEALLRWQHPVRGMVSPVEFVPFAEQTGFIRVLTRWVMHEATRLWPNLACDGRPISLSINLSARDLLDADLPLAFAARFEDMDVPPHAFCLEITESSIMDDPVRSQQTLDRLSAMGFRLAIDDYGTGYSSLAYLRRLPVNELKIDMSFVRTMDTDADNAQIVRSTIDLAHSLGLSVVAEGIENEVAWGMLRTMGCEQGQGYFIAKPMPAEDFPGWVAQWQERRRPLARV